MRYEFNLAVMFRDRALGVVIGLNVANKAVVWLNLVNLENFLKLMIAQLLSFSMYETYVQSVAPNRKKKVRVDEEQITIFPLSWYVVPWTTSGLGQKEINYQL